MPCEEKEHLDPDINQGMQTSVWGPTAWIFLHCITMGYPYKIEKSNRDHKNRKKSTKRFFKLLGEVMPCKYCRDSYKKFFKETFDDNVLSSRKKLAKWFFNLHNKVNTKIGVPDCDIPSFEDFYNRYENYRARCRPTTEAERLSRRDKGCSPRKPKKCTVNIVDDESKINKSSFSFIHEHLYTKKGPEVIIFDKLGDCEVEIFGEIHNKDMGRQNLYKALLKQDLSNSLLVFEHCDDPEIKRIENEIFSKMNKREQLEYINKLNGSEYLFTSILFKDMNVNMVCADNRISKNFLSGREEHLFTQYLAMSKVNDETLHIYVELFKKLLAICDNVIKNKAYYEYVKEYYDELTQSIHRQSKIFVLCLKHIDKTITIDGEEVDISIILHKTLTYFLENIKKLGSITVDENLLSIIASNVPKYRSILIFTGTSHAIRLAMRLPNTDRFLEDIDKNLMELSSPFPRGNKDSEKKVFRELQSL